MLQKSVFTLLALIVTMESCAMQYAAKPVDRKSSVVSDRAVSVAAPAFQVIKSRDKRLLLERECRKSMLNETFNLVASQGSRHVASFDGHSFTSLILSRKPKKTSETPYTMTLQKISEQKIVLIQCINSAGKNLIKAESCRAKLLQLILNKATDGRKRPLVGYNPLVDISFFTQGSFEYAYFKTTFDQVQIILAQKAFIREYPKTQESLKIIDMFFSQT